MIVVIQCAAGKRTDAGRMRRLDGTEVLFVARPGLAPQGQVKASVRPDDDSGDGRSWRQALLGYNMSPGNNPMGLLPAYQLYANETYRLLVDRLGIENAYILSAGWGLLKSSFLTPYYDITFSAAAERYMQRKKDDSYRDLQMLSANVDDEVIFLGGKDYLPFFCSLTSDLRIRRTIFYNSRVPPVAPACALRRFATTTRTNWHYQCARWLLEGAISTGQA